MERCGEPLADAARASCPNTLTVRVHIGSRLTDDGRDELLDVIDLAVGGSSVELTHERVSDHDAAQASAAANEGPTTLLVFAGFSDACFRRRSSSPRSVWLQTDRAGRVLGAHAQRVLQAAAAMRSTAAYAIIRQRQLASSRRQHAWQCLKPTAAVTTTRADGNTAKKPKNIISATTITRPTAAAAAATRSDDPATPKRASTYASAARKPAARPAGPAGTAVPPRSSADGTGMDVAPPAHRHDRNAPTPHAPRNTSHVGGRVQTTTNAPGRSSAATPCHSGNGDSALPQHFDASAHEPPQLEQMLRKGLLSGKDLRDAQMATNEAAILDRPTGTRLSIHDRSVQRLMDGHDSVVKRNSGNRDTCQLLAFCHGMVPYEADGPQLRDTVDALMRDIIMIAQRALPLADKELARHLINGFLHVDAGKEGYASTSLAECLSISVEARDSRKWDRGMTELGEGMMLSLLFNRRYHIFSYMREDIYQSSDMYVTYDGQPGTDPEGTCTTLFIGAHYEAVVSNKTLDGVNIGVGIARHLADSSSAQLLAIADDKASAVRRAFQAYCTRNAPTVRDAALAAEMQDNPAAFRRRGARNRHASADSSGLVAAFLAHTLRGAMQGSPARDAPGRGRECSPSVLVVTTPPSPVTVDPNPSLVIIDSTADSPLTVDSAPSAHAGHAVQQPASTDALVRALMGTTANSGNTVLDDNGTTQPETVADRPAACSLPCGTAYLDDIDATVTDQLPMLPAFNSLPTADDTLDATPADDPVPSGDASAPAQGDPLQPVPGLGGGDCSSSGNGGRGSRTNRQRAARTATVHQRHGQARSNLSLGVGPASLSATISPQPRMVTRSISAAAALAPGTPAPGTGPTGNAGGGRE